MANSYGNSGDGGPATSAKILQTWGVAVDRAGNVYIALQNHDVIRKIDTAGNISTIAGTSSTPGYTGDGGPAAQATLHSPEGLAIDAAGNLYIADSGNNAIRKIDTNGNISTVAGGNGSGNSGDGGLATQAKLNQPFGVAVDAAGNVYIADTDNHEIRKIDVSTGMISDVAGISGSFGYTGDGGAATSAKINTPYGVAVDPHGDLYIADTNNNVIRMVDTEGTIHTIAGNGTSGLSGDNGLPTSAELNHPRYVAVDAVGTVYISDTFNNEVRVIDGTGNIKAFAGNGTSGTTVEGLAASATNIGTPGGIALDPQGNVYFSNEGDSIINKVSTNGNTYFPTTLATETSNPLLGGGGSPIDGSSVTRYVYLQLNSEMVLKSIGLPGTTTDPSMPNGSNTVTGGQFTVMGTDGCVVNGTTPNPAGTVCVVAVTFTPRYPGQQSAPLVVTDGSGRQYFFGLIGTGKGSLLSFSPAAESLNLNMFLTDSLSSPAGVAVDNQENIYIADSGKGRIVKTQIFGSTTGPMGGQTIVDTGDVTLAEPMGVAVDAVGNLYIADYGLPTITKVTPTGAVSSIGAAGLDTQLSNASGVAVDKDGDIFVADKGNNRIVEITPQGNGIVVNTGSLTLHAPEGVAVDSSNNLYIADTFNNRVVKVAADGTASVLSTGDITLGLAGAVAVDAAGDVYVSNVSVGQGEIIEIPPVGSAYVVNTVSLPVADVAGIALDPASNMVFTDGSANAFSAIGLGTGGSLTFADTAVGSTSSDSPKAVKVQNIGNAPLNFTAPATGSNPTYPAGFSADTNDTNLCGSNVMSLASGAVCDVSVNFTPTMVGPNPGIPNPLDPASGEVMLADDALNQTYPSQPIRVSGNGLVAIDHFTVVPTTTTLTAGNNFNVTVTALKADGSVSTGYTGTVKFTSSDAQAGLPDDYTFVAGDNGVHTFNVTLKTAGAQTVTATDSVTSTATGEADVLVSAATPSLFTAQSSTTISAIIGGFLSDMQVKLTDAYNNPIQNVTVTFTSPATGASTSKASVTESTNVDGVATYFAIANGTVGSYQVVASTDAIATPVTFNASNSMDATTTVLSASPSDTATYGQSVTLTATVTPGVPNEPGVVSGRGGLHPMMSDPTLVVGPATGTVTFYDGTRVLGTATLGGNAGVAANSRGGVHANSIGNTETSATATLTISAPTAGAHSYTATYAGDANFDTSSVFAPVPYTVAKAAVVLAGPATQPVSANPGQEASIPVTVTGAASGTGVVLPGGTVNYQIGSGDPQTATVVAGQATLTVPSTLTAGNYSISMTYSGDANYQETAAVVIPLVEVTPDYSLTANPSSLTLRNGQTGVVDFTFAPVGGYKGTVNFSCAGLPVGVTCTFGSPSLTADGSNTVQHSQLTITTQGPNHGTVGANVEGGHGNIAMTSVFFLPGMLFGVFLIWERKRLPIRARQLLLVVVMVSTISGMIGCGTSPRTAPGTSNVTVTATASATGGGGAVSHTASFTLIITN